MTRMRPRFARWLIMALFAASVLVPAPAQAAPPLQEPTPVPGDAKARADALFDEGVALLFNVGDYEGALVKFLEARELYHALGELELEADVWTGVGLAYDHLGQSEQALAAQQAALGLARQAGSRRVEGDALVNIAEVYLGLEQYQESLSTYQQALAVMQEAGDQVGQGTVLNYIGVVYYYQGHYAEALESFQQALAMRQEIGDRAKEGDTLNNIGVMYKAQGRYAEALESFQQALAIRREMSDWAGEGDILHNIGDVYQAQGRYVEALEMFQKALVIAQETGDRSGEGTTLNKIGAVYQQQGRYAEALKSCQQALAIAREVSDRLGEADTLGNIGAVYYAQGRYAEALENFQQGLAIRQKLGDRAGEGTALNNIGSIYYHQGRYIEALESYQQALGIKREIGDRAGEGSVLHNIGDVYQAQGRYAQALESYQQALGIAREVSDRSGEGNTLNSIGDAYQQQGRYAEALEAYGWALGIRREVGDRAGEGVALAGVGGVYAEQGRYAEALEMFQQALAIAREVGGQTREGTALHNIGYVYWAQGRHAEALENYQQALAIQRKVGDRTAEGNTLMGIGVVYEAQGRYAEALESYQQALAIAREVGDRGGEGDTLHNIGAVYHAQGHYAEAMEMYRQALVVRREVSNRTGEGNTLNNIGGLYHDQGRDAQALENFQQALVIYQEVGNRAWEGNTLYNIGAVYEAQGRSAEALPTYGQAMDILEALRAVAGSEPGRASFIAQYAGLYTKTTGLFYHQGQYKEAFYTSERGRARAFLDSLTTDQVQLGDSIAAELLAQEREAYARRQAAQDALAKAHALAPPDPKLVADLEKQLSEAEDAYEKTQAAIEARGGQLAALVPGRSTGTTILRVPQVQALLDEETTLISYFVLEDKTLAFLITRDSFEAISFDVSREELVTQITAFRDFPNLDVAYPDSAVTLYNWLIAPLKEHLPSASSGQATTPHLAIIPHSILHYLPFAALTDGQRYLVDDYVLTTLPSASALSFIQENAHLPDLPGSSELPGRSSPLILGNPVTGDFDAMASFATERDGLGPLPFAEQEAKAIAALYGVEPLLGEDASEGVVRGRADQAGILHLAAHGYYNPVAPLSSLIALAPDDPSESSGQVAYDGWLTVGEVYGLDLSQADLVVLSACQTNLGDLSEGDELVGLTRAFIFAGTPTVVASLWAVDDEATSLLMERFYTHLHDGIGKAEALRQAQIEVRAEYPHPYFWSAFVVTGDPGKVTGKAVVSDATPIAAATEEVAPEPAQESEERRLCIGATLPLGLVALAGLGRKRRHRIR